MRRENAAFISLHSMSDNKYYVTYEQPLRLPRMPLVSLPHFGDKLDAPPLWTSRRQ